MARSEAELARLARELQTGGSKAAVAVADLGDPDAARQIAEAAAAELGTVDVLVSIRGHRAADPLPRRRPRPEIGNVLQVHDQPATARPAAALARSSTAGIINISSTRRAAPVSHTEAYAAAKDGLTAFSRVLHSDYRDTGVTATSIILGPVKDTGVSARTLAETGLTASTAFSVSPQKVAAATLRAIGNPKAEIVVRRPGWRSKRSWTTSPAWARPSTGSAAPSKLMASVADYREATRTPADNNSPAA